MAQIFFDLFCNNNNNNNNNNEYVLKFSTPNFVDAAKNLNYILLTLAPIAMKIPQWSGGTKWSRVMRNCNEKRDKAPNKKFNKKSFHQY
ncbi:hypothetical protein EG340_15275 [Chryseobacterium indoltheticum]|uniref:Uncharacterized protein n=1 Tax=Chryseobacterium indoltheticum TaxID=254 RepID=A0A3G6NBJ8_9FLAO|nr:hypothetical protein EG340_15275 [Chryseobacterium indoltheticum]